MGSKGSNKLGGITQDPNFLKYLNSITGNNISNMKQTYSNLGLDTSSTSKGMSPQESMDLGWLAQGAAGTGTEGFLQGAANQVANIQQNLNQAGQAGLGAGLSAGLTG